MVKPRYRLRRGGHNSYALLFEQIGNPVGTIVVPRHLWSTWSLGVWA